MAFGQRISFVDMEERLDVSICINAVRFQSLAELQKHLANVGFLKLWTLALN